MAVNWFDTHAHLNDVELADQVPEMIARAQLAGVVGICVIGTGLADSMRAVALARQFHILHAVVGLQPNNLLEVGENDFEEVRALADDPHVVGIGETGLDRYWQLVPMDQQRDYFLRHLELADSLNLPVVIHCREAETDIVAALADFTSKTGRGVRGVMHSFTGDQETAAKCLALGLHISFAGMVTFKKNDALRQVAQSVPLNRLLIETDTPYLSPEPHRGKQNEPARVIHTGEALAKVKGVAAEELARTTTENAIELFGLDGSSEPRLGSTHE